MKNNLLTMRGASPLTCVWRLTGDARSPLACAWVRSYTNAAITGLTASAASSPNDETGRMRQCA